MRKETVWMIKNSSGLLPWCAAISKEDAIEMCIFSYHGKYTWKQLYRGGYRCIKVSEVRK